jgi:hypothetical protein
LIHTTLGITLGIGVLTLFHYQVISTQIQCLCSNRETAINPVMEPSEAKHQNQKQQQHQSVHFINNETENKQQQDCHQKEQEPYQTPSQLFATNKNGFPLIVQREIVSNIKHYKGVDDVVREACDNTLLLFGIRNSQFTTQNSSAIKTKASDRNTRSISKNVP